MMSMSSMNSNGMGGGGHFVKQTFVSSTKMGPDGRPISEKYQTKAQGAFGSDGNRIAERQQMYENSGTGLQKASHERVFNDKGRKIVKERLGDQMNSYDHYKNMRDEEASQFDSAWQQAAQ